MTFSKTISGLLLICLLSVASQAFAHGGHDPRLKIAVGETEIRVEMGLDSDMFSKFDEDKDGHLTVQEYENNYASIVAWVNQELALIGSEGRAISAFFSDAPIVDRVYLKPEDKIENIKVLRRYKIRPNVEKYKLHINFSNYEPHIVYSRSGHLTQLFKFEICLGGAGQPDLISCYFP